METWIIYALISGTLFGLSNFFLKPIAQKNLNKHKIFLYGVISSLFFSWIYLLIYGAYFEFGFLVFLMIIGRETLALEKNFFIIESLKYIESSIFFPIHKIIHVILSFFVGMFIFWEYLWFSDFVAIFLWVIMILLLSNKENKKIQINYKKWIYFLALANVVILGTSTINKYISTIDFDIQTYIFISSVIGVIYLLGTKKAIYKKSDINKNKSEIFYGVLKWVLVYFGFISLLTSLSTWPLVLVQMIHTFSIIIPVILSIIFYKEKVNTSKILSLLLFLGIVGILTFF